MPEYLSIAKVAAKLHVHRNTVKAMIERGDIPANVVIQPGPRSMAVLASFVDTLQPKPEGQYHFSQISRTIKAKEHVE